MRNEELLTRITNALRSLSANDLQRLAEDMAKLNCKELEFATLMRQGRNEESQTNKGWPDAYVDMGANKVYGVEATRQGTWKTHLSDDLKKAKDPGNFDLCGYYFVGGYPTSEPTSTDISTWADKFVALGVPATSVTILIGKHLAMELQDPKYARICQTILGIPCTPEIFKLFVPGLLADRNLGEFQPTEDDFKQHRVLAPSALETVNQQLANCALANVKGYGAAGKTTLAQLICAERSPRTSYYLDLSAVTEADAADAKRDIVDWSTKGVLFVIDNIHQNLSLAKDLIAHWKVFGKIRDSQLLQLGRITFGAPPNTNGSFILLEAGVAEMKGVVHRLFSREGLLPPQVDVEIVNAWISEFGGRTEKGGVDLVAFSAAAHGRLADLKLGDFRLNSLDAVEAVRTKYLSSLSPEERENLVRLSVLAEYEIPLSIEDLPHPSAGFRVSCETLGIVLQHQLGKRDVRKVYSLVHAALGKLIVDAISTVNRTTEIVSISISRPNIAIRLLSGVTDKPLRGSIESSVVSAFDVVSWPDRCQSLRELLSVLRSTRMRRWCTLKPTDPQTQGNSDALDSKLCGDANLAKLLDQNRALSVLNDFIVRITDLKLSKTCAWLEREPIRSTLVRDISSYPAKEVALFLRLQNSRIDILNGLDRTTWNLRQSAVPPQLITDGVAAFRYFEGVGCRELALTPSRRILESSDQYIIDDGVHLAHVSHLIRFSASSPERVLAFVQRLHDLNKLPLICSKMNIRHLCGAMLSLANHCTSDAKILLLPNIGNRVLAETDNHQKTSDVAEIVCMLGAYAALGGNPTLSQDLSDRLTTANLFTNKLFAGELDVIGSYEVQLWLGIQYLATKLVSIPIPTAVESRFFVRLKASVAPSEEAKKMRLKLLNWGAERANASPSKNTVFGGVA